MLDSVHFELDSVHFVLDSVHFVLDSVQFMVHLPDATVLVAFDPANYLVCKTYATFDTFCIAALGDRV
jgi:hypothetical protein